LRRIPADALAILAAHMAEDEPPPREDFARSRLAGLLFGRQLTPRRAARLIAGASLLLTVVGGVAARLIDEKDFDSIQDALWWALQTVTTVGYGDVVPSHTSGRLIGAALMLQGIALLTVVTAAITAMLVEQARQRLTRSDQHVLDQLDRIEARLAAMEAGGERPSPD
jgi:voltage-gated potassium channel